MIIQIIFGWPVIVLFMLLATYAAWARKRTPMIIACLLSVLPSLYLIGGDGWIQLLAVYIPVSLSFSIFLMSKKMYLAPRILLIPAYGFYGWLATAVITQ